MSEEKNDIENTTLKIYFLNVGQGDSSIIIFPNKNVYLIDTNYTINKFDVYKKEIEYIFKQNNINLKEIKALIITHRHLDHINGMVKLLDWIKVNSILINDDYKHYTKATQILMKKIHEKGIPIVNINRKNKWVEGTVQIEADVLNPQNTNNVNDSSIVISIKNKNTNAYLTGDASAYVIEKVCGISKNKGLLKVSHHASYTGTSKKIINDLVINHAFISVGNNRYSHPNKLIMDMLIKVNTICSRDISKKVFVIN